MRRRTFLAAAGLGLSGCAGISQNSAGSPNVVLSEPDRPFDSADVPYPAWSEQLPEASVKAPLENRKISIRSVQKPRLLTFFYSSCPSVCQVLISTLRNVQTHALNNGYSSEVAFLPMTFDPARDDEPALRQYGNRRNIDTDNSNWHFLRPASEQRAKTVITEKFGVTFEKTYPTPDGSTADSSSKEESADKHDHGEYTFAHTPLTVLANGDGYVERAYQTPSPDVQTILNDLETVRNA